MLHANENLANLRSYHKLGLASRDTITGSDAEFKGPEVIKVTCRR